MWLSLCYYVGYCTPLTLSAGHLCTLPLRPQLRVTPSSQPCQQLLLRLSETGELHRRQSRDLHLQLRQHLPPSSGERMMNAGLSNNDIPTHR